MAQEIERLDIEACEENLGIYAQRGDARSCRDIGLALARELTAVRERADQLGDLAEWLASLRPVQGIRSPLAGPPEVRLNQAIARAREALGRTEEG